VGVLGELGPIDPQVGGLPALGVSQALRSIAAVSERFPKSAEMFARYLRLALTVEQIGYCERICESAQQYAQRLLTNKIHIDERQAAEIARLLVHEYKDHSFVIDREEATKLLGGKWVLPDTAESAACEEIYHLFDNVNFWLGLHKKRRLIVSGELAPRGTFAIPASR
jgi:hypothetical protein